MGASTDPSWVSFLDPYVWLDYFHILGWYACSPFVWLGIYTWIIWRRVEARRKIGRKTFLFAKTVLPIVFTVFCASGHLHLSLDHPIKEFLLYVFAISVHILIFVGILIIQPAKEKLEHRNSDLWIIHYLILITSWCLVQWFLYFYFPPVNIPFEMDDGGKRFAEVLTCALSLSIPALVLVMIAETVLCFRAPCLVYKKDGVDTGGFFLIHDEWLEIVRESYEVNVPVNPKRKIIVSAAEGPRRTFRNKKNKKHKQKK
ncbi:hypothetical protein L5515_018456 [Caenorhabditis briggsae]|uniref:Uncharacterized protein n=1 Tax=Caenorhabditis briggsae TaxID=6238 RepID=A0AAE9FFW1_CAEBR|nr:hypothetical protein L5515_018456 [Caenorhabditis briggsae]